MKIQYTILFFLIVIISLAACKSGSNKHPKIAFDNYKIANGFEIQLAASEPLIEAPVAMDFDDGGRMWVVEMRGFMPNLAGTGDDAPNGRISILEDDDHDGVADRSVTFLDSLVLPRAISHVYGGLLYTIPPFLWFVEINNNKPGKRTLVDSTYAEGGSPEAQPNGLMMNIDNWIYSANAHYRYQLRDGKWIKEPTSFRGQFGITKDNFGRLYYNYNEIQIAGDYVLPNTLINNPYFKPKVGINELLTQDQRVYPLHPTTVNRGYAKDILDKDSLLVNVTAACGPLIYRGDRFPDDYNQNAFVCEPQANLVKRDILTFAEDKTIAVQAWNDREFLASTDEGFRPVNLFNGPDGEMYVVDMHRGIMEYRAFTTPYYNSGIAQKKLDTLLHAGRILRIKSKRKEVGKIPDLTSASGTELVSLLKSSNGWIRDRAQQLIIYKQDKSVVPELEQLANDSNNFTAAIHALHTLEGLHALSFEFLKKVAALGEPMLTAHALLLLQQYSAGNNVKAMEALATDLLSKNNPVINLYLALSLGAWNEVSNGAFLPILEKISKMYPDKGLYPEAIVSSLKGWENNFQKIISKAAPQKSTILDTLLAETIKNKRDGKMNSIFVQVKTPPDARTNGLAIFRSTCATCHGLDGDGIEHVAPPLKGSEYVEGSPQRLAMIILNGLEGPIHMNGKLYNFNGTMPNFANNYTDKDIADVIEYLHNAYVTKPVKSIHVDKIKALRNTKSGTLREQDLLEMDNLNN
ncbi:c-type cytochrome [Ilyomonas limi]|uniref:C-type cytochrome n=1 Tax=Ilyomonas limi TaxID=2575867 RepID=A0A4U3KS42_9BACT|nr:c-type cytochrome [Ilyomonas limi]TKK65112.1 c-type cytochrome [Ilyomonas limi]